MRKKALAVVLHAMTIVVLLAAVRINGEETRGSPTNLLANPSFEEAGKDAETSALGWGHYRCGYTRTSEKSCAPDISGPWSCRITGSGKENEVGFGGAMTFSRPGFPEQGAFTARNSIYVAGYTQGEIFGVYITVQYTDKTEQNFSLSLSNEQISANLNKWKTYSLTFATDPARKIGAIVYWCMVLPKNGKFIGTIYFDEADLRVAHDRADTESALPFSVVGKTAAPPLLDGKMSDACWSNCMEFSPFFLNTGSDLASQQTKAYLTYDQTNLYLFFNALESALDPVLQQMAEFKAEQTRLDSNVWEDDCLEIFLKPPHAQGVYYHIIVNSRGAIYDAECGAGFDTHWASRAEAKTFKDEKAWYVEMAIPFQSLGQSCPADGESWKINLCREEKPKKEGSSWSSPKGGFHKVNDFGEIRFTQNALGSRLQSLGNRLEGANHLEISLINNGSEAEVVTVDALIKTVDDLAQPNIEKFRILPGKSADGNIEYGVDGKSRAFAYEILRNDTLLYASPAFPFAPRTVFFNKTVVGSRSYAQPLTTFHLIEGEFLYLPLVIRSSLDKQAVNTCECVLDVPYFLRLLNPTGGKRKVPSPVKMTESQTNEGDMKIRRYTLTFDAKSITFPGAVRASDLIVNPLIFTSELAGNASAPYEIRYRILLTNQPAITGKVALRLLPPQNSVTATKIPIVNWPCGGTFYPQFLGLSTEEQSEIVKSWKRTGFNVYYSHLSLDDLYKTNNLKTIGYPVETLEQMCALIPPEAIYKYLETRPQYRAVTADGRIKNGVVSYAGLLDPACPLRKEIKEQVGKLTRKYGELIWDYEFSVTSPESVDFSEANIESFRKFAKIPADVKLAPAGILKNYRSQWVDFRCFQNAELAGFFKEGLREADPNYVFSVYSGYQGDSTREGYGVDWKYMSKYADRVWCGYGRAGFEGTLKAINGKPLIGGEIAWLGDGSVYDLDASEVNLFRRLTDCGGGIMTYYDWTTDGRFYKAVSDVAAVAADFEPFFSNYSRCDSRAEVLSGGKENVTCLENGPNRLLFLFNEGSGPKAFKLKMLNSSSNMIAIDYREKKAIDGMPLLETTVPAWNVKTISFQDKNTRPAPAVPEIISPVNEKVLTSTPVFRWTSKNAGSVGYTLEYSTNKDFPEKSTARITNLPANCYPVRQPLDETRQYYWRVRAVDAANGRESPHSKTGVFSFEPLVRADVSPLCFSPNGDGNFDAVTVQAELRGTGWICDVLDSGHKIKRSFSGKGKEVLIAWDGKDGKDKPLPEGIYTLALKTGGAVVLEKNIELNMRFGQPNPGIEKWCVWSPRVWAGAVAEKDYRTVCDNRPYALTIQGNNNEASADWSNYHTGTEIPITAGKKYSYTAYLKTALQDGGEASITLRFFTKDDGWAAIPGLETEWTGIDSVVKGKTDWTSYTVSCRAPDNAAKAVLFFSLKGKGTAWMGAVEFKECKE